MAELRQGSGPPGRSKAALRQQEHSCCTGVTPCRVGLGKVNLRVPSSPAHSVVIEAAKQELWCLEGSGLLAQVSASSAY